MPKHFTSLGSAVDAPFIGRSTAIAHYPACDDYEEFFTVRRIADGAEFQCRGRLLTWRRQAEWRKLQFSAAWYEYVAIFPAAAIPA
jgi:hypothetical protein